MKFVLGSKSERKIRAVEKVIGEFVSKDKFEIEGFAANSGVPDTPWDKETFDGARNRALDSKENIKADFWLGVESGLVERYGHVYEEAWCTIVNIKGKDFFGFSSGLKVPDYIIQEMGKRRVPHFEIMGELEKELDLIENETWGNYSGGVISREVSLIEATRNALIQAFPHSDSLYKK